MSVSTPSANATGFDGQDNKAPSPVTPAQFNRALLDFIKDLALSFPHVEGFRRAYASTNLMSTIQPNMVQTLFNRFISSYTDQILQHNEAFFLQKDYSEELATAGENIEIVTVLKQVWTGLQSQDKDSIWRHMEVLVALNHAVESAKVL